MTRVKEFCKTCVKCQSANRYPDVIMYMSVLSLCRKFDKTSAELHPISVKGEVWHTIGVDLIGPLPETPRTNKYIKTVSCLFSKWPEATANSPP